MKNTHEMTVKINHLVLLWAVSRNVTQDDSKPWVSIKCGLNNPRVDFFLFSKELEASWLKKIPTLPNVMLFEALEAKDVVADKQVRSIFIIVIFDKVIEVKHLMFL